MQAERNSVSDEIGQRRRRGEDAGDLIQAMQRLGQQLKELENEVRRQDADLRRLQLLIPNLPHPSVPPGAGEEENVEVRRWGEPRDFDFEPSAHWDLGTDLGVLDFERAARISGSRFTVFRG